MSDTPNIGFPLLEQAQAQKEVTVNETLVILDALLGGVISQSTTAPPGSPAEGDAYIVPIGASGVWVGHVEDVAYFFGGVWNFLPPSVGVGHQIWVQDDAEFVQYSDVSPQAWIAAGGAGVTSVNGATGSVSLNGGYVGVKGADIASAGTTNLATATGDFVDVTGTTTITALGTVAAGTVRRVRFTGALTLTHNGTSLILPGAANISTAAGDTAQFVSLGSGNWLAFGYQRSNGKAVVETAPTAPTQFIAIAVSDETTSLTAGTAKATFRMPYAFTLTDVRASVTTAPTGGTLLTVDVNESGSTILSTKLTFDASEKTTTTAATPRVISDSSLADDAEITIDIDAVGSTIAGAGLKVYLIGTKT